MSNGELGVAFAIDIVAIVLLAFALYLPRHQRRDLVLAFIGVNVGLFAVGTLVADNDLNVGVGLGLFALLSVVRLRSSEIAQEEIGYYFIALVLGLINGFEPQDHWSRTILLNVALRAVMFLADHPRIVNNRRQQVVTLDEVFDSEDELRAELERRLGAKVTRLLVSRTDFVHRHTVVDVRYRKPEGRRRGDS
jgi:hypothetical protein